MINSIDTNIYNSIFKLNSELTTLIMAFISHLGSATILIMLCVVFAILQKTRKISLLVTLNLAISYTLNSIIKLIVARPRPNVLPLVYEEGYSFPSGHAMVCTAFYGFLIYITYKNVKNKFLKNAIIYGLNLLIFLIGISRIYLGVHYATDVLGGFIIGIVYLVLFIIIINKVKSKKIENKKIDSKLKNKNKEVKNKIVK